MRTMRSKIGVALTGAAVTLVMAGCGSGSAQLEARQLSGIGILEKTKPLDQNLVKRSEIDKTSNVSGLKTLLQLWQTLQYQDYDSAPDFFYPKLTNFVGLAQLALALRTEGALWSSTKPSVVEATTTRNKARIVFVIHNLLGKATPVTVSFRKLGGTWKIDYLTLLDEALRTWAQQRTQLLSTSSSSQSAKEGLAAGTRAFQLQSLYLEKEHTGSIKADLREASSLATANERKTGKTG